MTDTNIHAVTKFELGEIQTIGEHKPFYIRHLYIETKDGQRSEITLFSDDKQTLKVEVKTVTKI